MKKLSIIILFLLNTNFVLANNIAVIDIETIISKNIEFTKFVENLTKSQIEYEQKLNLEEKKLKDELINIENEKLILSENELLNKIEKYNSDLEIFKKKVNKFNNHYQNEILVNRNYIIQQIIILLENYAKKNNISVIFDATNYILAADSINLTNEIEEGLNKINLELRFNNFEN